MKVWQQGKVVTALARSPDWRHRPGQPNYPLPNLQNLSLHPAR